MRLSKPQFNSNKPENRGPQLPQYLPYELEGDIIVQAKAWTNYRNMIMQLKSKTTNVNQATKSGLQTQDKYEKKQSELLKKNDGYHDQMIKHIQKIKPQLLKDPVYIFIASIYPQNIHWQFWKHKSEIKLFIKEFYQQIKLVENDPERHNFHDYQNIKNNYEIVKTIDNNITSIWSQSDIQKLVQLLNQIGQHPFFRKSVKYLIFVQHCLPLHLWNLKVFQQVAVYYDRSHIKKFFYAENQIKQYLTVVGDGIIISTKNPMETKVDQMIPFTNQFQFWPQIQSDEDISFHISSCIHQNIQIDLKKNYIEALNFYIGTNRAIKSSGYLNNDPNRFNSFSTVRKNCWTKLYNDSFQYFSDLCDELRKAKKHVCITDWWLTPYIVLKRFDNPNEQYKNTIQKKNIDNRSRLDTVLQEIAKRGVKVYIILFREPLGLVCNDSEQCQDYLESLSQNIKVRRHPIVPQYWSHHQKCVIIDQRIGFMGGLDLCYGRWDNPKHYITNKYNLWDGADYANDRLRSYPPGTTSNINQSPLNSISECRMPWHDIAIMLRGDAVIDLAKHFIQYWYFVDSEKIKDPIAHLRNVKRRIHRTMQYQLPDFNNQWQQGRNTGCFNNMKLAGAKTKIFFSGTQNKLRQLLLEVRQGKQRGSQSLQLCRSASAWSIGAKSFECSIHQAYQTLIKQSQHLIYIENQFFMGKKNKVVECLADRIKKAHQCKQNFKVVVVMPLLPGFQGDITKRSSGPLRFQVNNQFNAITRSQNSLYNKLKGLTNFNIDDYIYFFGLRAHGTIFDKEKNQERPVTEIIYVHSKLMIVDDKRAIIGSANINDRSLCGDRDSQLAIVVEEDNGDILDGVPRRKQIFDLRVRLFQEHFGLTPQQTANSNNPMIWAKMINNAKNNTLIYRKIFQCYPDDTMTTSGQIQQRLIKDPSIKQYRKYIKDIFGHAVDFPLHFLEDENLFCQFGDNKQGMMLDQQAFL